MREELRKLLQKRQSSGKFIVILIVLLLISKVVNYENIEIIAVLAWFILVAIFVVYELGRREGWNDKDRWEIEKRNQKNP